MGYGVVGRLVIQVAATIVPALHLLDSLTTAVVVLTLLGFPIALVIAWAFEMTPDGMKRTATVSPNEKISQWKAQIDRFVLVVGLIATGLFAWQKVRSRGRQSVIAAGKSIAVLPFENRSEEKTNGYFADGIQDEILTRLARIDDLKVISRTSTQRYKSAPDNIPEIARQLGVAHLEGSVQKSGEQVRVNVQLIKADTDGHIWAEVYDRKLTDIFSVQSDIAENIARALRAKLTPGERRAVAAKPTQNPEAYDAYLRGLALWNGLSVSPETLQKAEEFFRRAVELDPKFAQAWANLSIVQTFVYAEFDPMTQRLVDAKRALETSMRLEPDLGDGFLALGLYRYRGLRDYDGALEAFQEALDRGVNRALSLEFMGYVKRRQGRWEETLALHAESSALDPRNAIIFSERAVTLRALRRFGEAHKAVDRALEINPDSSVLLAQKARLYQAEGDVTAAAQVDRTLSSRPSATGADRDARGPDDVDPSICRGRACVGRIARESRSVDGPAGSRLPHPTRAGETFRGRYRGSSSRPHPRQRRVRGAPAGNRKRGRFSRMAHQHRSISRRRRRGRSTRRPVG